MQIRKNPLVNDEIYHIFNRSIAKYIIFNTSNDYSRIIEMISFYRHKNSPCCYSKFKLYQKSFQDQVLINLEKDNNHLVEIIAYCIMPTHFHFILKQMVDDGISKFMAKVSNSYTKYFNTEHTRSGPLYEGHFKNILVKDDAQLLHLTRYVHLNPVSAGIINKPEDWEYSSYNDFLSPSPTSVVAQTLDIKPEKYQKFVEDQISYQRQLSKIKSLLIDNYAG